MKIEARDPEEFLHEEGVHIPAHIYAVEDAGEGEFGPQLKWIFLDEDDQEIWAWSSTTLSARSKLGKWATNLGTDISNGVDTDDYIGLTVNLVFERYNKADGTLAEKVVHVKAGDGKSLKLADLEKRAPLYDTLEDPF